MDICSMHGGDLEKIIQKCWEAAYLRALRPVNGVLLSESQAAATAERVVDELLDRVKPGENEVEFSAAMLESVARDAKHHVAEERKRSGDQQSYRDPEDTRYEHNLDLPKLSARDEEGLFSNREWNQLPPILRPLSMQTLAAKGVHNHNADDVFSEALTSLVKGRQSDGKAPVEQLVVFEEMIPLFCRITQLRAIDWIRKASNQKGQVNNGVSIEAGQETDGPGVQYEDERNRHEGYGDTLTFESIYRQTKEVLTTFEWKLVYTVYVAQTATLGELVERDDVLENVGSSLGDSLSTRRRRLNDFLQTVLNKIKNYLEN